MYDSARLDVLSIFWKVTHSFLELLGVNEISLVSSSL